ncbi:MAG TPA: TetR/AcrR family transcriptional regulator [Chitinophagales bacterium]|nr:TetR/AcrR family transcriptional regulator [Chitinophagales bacterium]
MKDKRQQILEAAEELFAEKGFEGTSVRELAKKAGINIAMISYYFGSKEKLFEALVEFRTSYIREKLQTLNRNEVLDPVSKIETAIDLYVDRISSFPNFHKILHHEMMLKQRSNMHDAIATILMKNSQEMKKLVHAGQQQGLFRKVDADLLVVSIVGTINQCSMSKTMTTRLLKLGKGSIFDAQPKKRLKNYLKDLVRSYLLNKKSLAS